MTTENGNLDTLAIQNNGNLTKVDSIPTPVVAAYAGMYSGGHAICIAF